MSEVLFRVSCPAEDCDDTTIHSWYHGQCPSSSNYYLTDQGLLRCDHCGEKFKIFDRTWKSSSCNHDYRKTSYERILRILTFAGISEHWPNSFIIKIFTSLAEQMD